MPEKNTIIRRGWGNLKYISPIKVLPKLRQLQAQLSCSRLDDNIKNLRKRKLKPHSEKRIAAIFCYCMACYLKENIVFASAPQNNLDYDIVLKYRNKNEVFYSHINVALRQGVLLTMIAIGCLLFQLLGALTWWSGLLLIAAVTLVEFYCMAKEEQ